MLKQFLNFKLSQKLSPQQIQLMKLIQLPTQAFEQRVSQEMNENPALEKGKEEVSEIDQDSNDDYQDTIEDASEINIDAYLSDDETPSYKLNANNYSADDKQTHMPYAAGQSFNMDKFKYIREINDGLNSVLEFETYIDDISVNGVDMIQWNDEGKIVDFKVMIRPLKAVNKVQEKMVEALNQLSK